MIVRVWRGATPERLSQRYLRYLRETGVRECRRTPGNRGVSVLRRRADGRAEFLFFSRWDSEEAVRRFAGPDPERAVFYPRDMDFLVEAEQQVRMYELALESGVQGDGSAPPGAATRDTGAG